MSYPFIKSSPLYKLIVSILMVLSCFILSSVFSNAFADNYKAGDIEISNVWSRATPNGAKVAGGFFTITNNGKTADRLVSVSSELSDKTQIHSMELSDGVMKMRHQADGIEIPAGATIEFKPGSYHVMFMDISKTLKAGDEIKGKLRFEKAGSVDVVFTVAGMGSQKPQAGSADHHE